MIKALTKENNNNSNVKRLAKLVSFLFDGSVLAVPILLSVFFAAKGRLIETLPSFFVSLAFLAIIPYLFILYLYKSKKICDLHMPKRKERVIPLIAVNLSILTGFIILTFMQHSRLLNTVYVIYLVGLPILSIITLFWKISFHASYVTIFSIVFVTIYGKWALFTILLIPLMIWARVKLKRHTIAQAVSGAALTIIISVFVLGLTGFTMSLHPEFIEMASVYESLPAYLNLNLFLRKIDNIFIIISVLTILLAYNIQQKSKTYHFLITGSSVKSTSFFLQSFLMLFSVFIIF